MIELPSAAGSGASASVRVTSAELAGGGPTITDTVAGALKSEPSLTRNVNVAVPVKPFCGGV